MPATPHATPNAWRLNNAYVDVPPSPLDLSQYRALKFCTNALTSYKLKENTPLQQSNLGTAQKNSKLSPLKRKLSHRDHAEETVNVKKSRLSVKGNVKPSLKADSSSKIGNTGPSPDFPDGFTYCHHCNRKRDVHDILYCTMYIPSKSAKPKERRCLGKYCRRCLKNRYGIDLDVIKSNKSLQPGHDAVHGYNFKCPKCQGTCNCSRCKKTRGLNAIGNLNTINIVPGVTENTTVIPKLKQLPQLKWTSLNVKLNPAEVEERIHIREFILRFNTIMEPPVARTILEELEDIGGKRGVRGGGNDQLWVSDACTKAIILALLGLLSQSYKRDQLKIIKVEIREIRARGANLNKIWSRLASLRESFITLDDLGKEPRLDFPDPRPSSTGALARTTRSDRRSSGGENLVHISNSAQFIPVILGLIQAALNSDVLKGELDDSIKDLKSVVQGARESIKKGKDQWEDMRKNVDNSSGDKAISQEVEDKKETPNIFVASLENALKLAMPGFSPRYEPFGRDHEGRIFYAISPSIYERAVALEFLELASTEHGSSQKIKQKGHALSEEERSSFKSWSWFIAVWGIKPSQGGGVPLDPVQSHLDESMENIEQWWVFWEPSEIRKVSEWISIKSGLENQGDEVGRTTVKSSPFKGKGKASIMDVPTRPTKGHLRMLVNALAEYAKLLEWRILPEKYGAQTALTNFSGIPPDRFYSR